MNRIFLIILLTPFLCNAKFYKGMVTMNDETIKKGFIELPEYPDDAKLKFRPEEKGKTEKISIDFVKGFEILNDKNIVVRYTTIFLADPKPFTKDQFKLDDKKSWVKILKEGKISIYYAYAVYNSGSGTGGFGSAYIKKGNEKYAYFIMDGGGGGLNFNMNGFHEFKKYFSKIFETDCPKLIEAVNKDDLNKNGLTFLVDIYEQNCGK